MLIKSPEILNTEYESTESSSFPDKLNPNFQTEAHYSNTNRGLRETPVDAGHELTVCSVININPLLQEYLYGIEMPEMNSIH